MGADASPTARLRRALAAGSLLQAEAAAREVGHLEDAGIAVAAEDLPDAERLREAGWLERRMDGDDAVYSLTLAGEAAMALNDLMAVDASEAS